jgi:hypothetical protein
MFTKELGVDWQDNIDYRYINHYISTSSSVKVQLHLRDTSRSYKQLCVHLGLSKGGGGKWDTLPHVPAMQGPPTDCIFIPNIYYHLAG